MNLSEKTWISKEKHDEMLHHNLLTIKATPSEWIVRFTPTNCINGKIAKFPMRPPNLSKFKKNLLRSS